MPDWEYRLEVRGDSYQQSNYPGSLWPRVILILNPDGHNLDKLKVGLWHLQGGRDRPDLDMIKRFLTPQNYVTDILALAGHLSRAETFL